jgi:hypothetical protein
MADLFHLTLVSRNNKTGPIPVSTSSADLCPVSCPFKGQGCYGESGPLALHWREVTAGRRGASWPDFLAQIAALPAGTFWRHNQAGDIQDPNTVAGRTALKQLVNANRGRRGFTFSHHPLTRAVVEAFKAATAQGFTVNASTETIDAADTAVSRGLRAAVVVPSTDTRRIWLSPNGNRVVTCPAQIHEGVTCSTCGLCQWRPASVIVAFRAHSTNRRRIDAWLPT